MLELRHTPGHLMVGLNDCKVTTMTTTGWGATWIRRHGDGGDLHLSIPLTNRGIYLSTDTSRSDDADAVKEAEF